MKRIMLCSGDGVCIVEVGDDAIGLLGKMVGFWLAVDSDGELWASQYKPNITGDMFCSATGFTKYVCDVELPKGVDWQHTMTKVSNIKEIIV